MKTLVLYECEKHPNDYEWDDSLLGDRINGILLQLISFLQTRKFPAYFLSQVDIFRGRDAYQLDLAAKRTWALQRDLLFNSKHLDNM